MQQRRTSRLSPVVRPLTPSLPEPEPIKRTNPANEVARLKGQLAAERRRHQRLEGAFAKYLAVLEQTCSALREACLIKNEPLIPDPLKRGKQ